MLSELETLYLSDMLGASPPLLPFFFLPVVVRQKSCLASVKTELRKVGSVSFCSGILNASGNLTYAKVALGDQTKTDKRTNFTKIASCSSLSSASFL